MTKRGIPASPPAGFSEVQLALGATPAPRSAPSVTTPTVTDARGVGVQQGGSGVVKGDVRQEATQAPGPVPAVTKPKVQEVRIGDACAHAFAHPRVASVGREMDMRGAPTGRWFVEVVVPDAVKGIVSRWFFAENIGAALSAANRET